MTENTLLIGLVVFIIVLILTKSGNKCEKLISYKHQASVNKDENSGDEISEKSGTNIFAHSKGNIVLFDRYIPSDVDERGTREYTLKKIPIPKYYIGLSNNMFNGNKIRIRELGVKDFF